MSHIGALSVPKRYITAHDAAGKSIFSAGVPEDIVHFGESTEDPSKKAAGEAMSPTASASSSIAYTTNKPPVDLADNVDVEVYKGFLANNATLPLPFVFPGGTTTHYSEIGPGLVTPMHQTVSVDQIVVLEGVLELILDSGERKLLKKHDMVVQRGTMHAWRNPSETQWVRFFAVVQPIMPVIVDGKELKEAYRGMPEI